MPRHARTQSPSARFLEKDLASAPEPLSPLLLASFAPAPCAHLSNPLPPPPSRANLSTPTHQPRSAREPTEAEGRSERRKQAMREEKSSQGAARKQERRRESQRQQRDRAKRGKAATRARSHMRDKREKIRKRRSKRGEAALHYLVGPRPQSVCRKGGVEPSPSLPPTRGVEAVQVVAAAVRPFVQVKVEEVCSCALGQG